ncbi:hypothetical protein DP116_05915 [Brasilonema bromeliae SPC951]|uniref:LAGLIDADG homing endonuclease n=1 Tax=Brasilonema bromeliae SPC951 TaxID=385972 RepID=A0ABX1P5J9_9CYAN|nr:hypothetical protein [Brasilonema bromeliae SPC951]
MFATWCFTNSNSLNSSLILKALQSTYVNPIDVYKLDSLGLICFKGDRILPSCELYRAYFEKQLATTRI